MLITGNIIRALQRIKAEPDKAVLLVEPEYVTTALNLIGESGLPKPEDNESFSLEDELRLQYGILKKSLNGMIDSTGLTKEDLDVLKEGQRFLSLIIRQEEKINDINAIKAFKLAVLSTLDAVDPELKKDVLKRLENG